jgi:hypothetical protein
VTAGGSLRPTRSALAALALVVAATTGCGGGGGSRVRAVVSRGVRADSLVIRLEAAGPAASAPAVEEIAVRLRNVGRAGGTSGAPYWYVARRPGAAPLALPADVRYGVVPPGFAEGQRPIGLPLGAYEVDVKAGSRRTTTYFRVTTADRVE